MRKIYDFSHSISNPFVHQKRRFSLYDLILSVAEKTFFRSLTALRQELISNAHGEVLEVGIGTGQNLKFYTKDVKLTGIEPNPQMEEVSSVGSAENLPFENESFDFVVSTLTLCSIPKPELALNEMIRVLKPNGKLLLLEHVRKNAFTGTFQDIATPVWKIIAGGCHLNRDLDALVKKLNLKTLLEKRVWNSLGRYLILEKS